MRSTSSAHVGWALHRHNVNMWSHCSSICLPNKKKNLTYGLLTTDVYGTFVCVCPFARHFQPNFSKSRSFFYWVMHYSDRIHRKCGRYIFFLLLNIFWIQKTTHVRSNPTPSTAEMKRGADCWMCSMRSVEYSCQPSACAKGKKSLNEYIRIRPI